MGGSRLRRVHRTPGRSPLVPAKPPEALSLSPRYFSRLVRSRPPDGATGAAPLGRNSRLDKANRRAMKNRPNCRLRRTFFKTCCIKSTLSAAARKRRAGLPAPPICEILSCKINILSKPPHDTGRRFRRPNGRAARAASRPRHGVVRVRCSARAIGTNRPYQTVGQTFGRPRQRSPAVTTHVRAETRWIRGEVCGFARWTAPIVHRTAARRGPRCPCGPNSSPRER